MSQSRASTNNTYTGCIRCRSLSSWPSALGVSTPSGCSSLSSWPTAVGVLTPSEPGGTFTLSASTRASHTLCLCTGQSHSLHGPVTHSASTQASHTLCLYTGQSHSLSLSLPGPVTLSASTQASHTLCFYTGQSHSLPLHGPVTLSARASDTVCLCMGHTLCLARASLHNSDTTRASNTPASTRASHILCLCLVQSHSLRLHGLVTLCFYTGQSHSLPLHGPVTLCFYTGQFLRLVAILPCKRTTAGNVPQQVKQKLVQIHCRRVHRFQAHLRECFSETGR